MKKTKLVLAMLCLGLLLGFSHPTAYAAEEMLSNLNAQNYGRWASPVNDYLVKCSNGQYMSVQGTNSRIYVQYYDSAFNVVSAYTIPAELPIFGAFYEDANYYYILSGQTNYEELDSVEVYRITKYDKTWNRLGSAGLYGANTTIPFDAGSARIDSYGNFLAIRTCHEMYTSSDGLNHQANVMILVDTEKMEITDSYTKVMNNGYGYVSHSFNQFVKIDNGMIVGVDHGDAHPRAVYLAKYPDTITDGKLHSDAYRNNYNDEDDTDNWNGPHWGSGVSYLNVYPIQPAVNVHYNYTGVTVGGFEFSDSNYLIAGTSVPQDENWEDKETKNVFVSVVDKESGNVTTNWITEYAEGEASASTPHLVKLGDNSFMLIWYRDGAVNYVKLNGAGQTVGKVYQFEGFLSECHPVVADGKLTWYICDYGNQVFFYQIDLSNLSNVTRTQSGVETLQMETESVESAYSIAKITGVYIPENDGRQIRAGAIIETSATDITYECTVIDYDYAKYGTSFFPETKRTTDKNDNWMVYTPSHPGMYGFCWRAYDAQGNLLSEYGATHYFEGNTVSNVGIYVPDRNAQTLDFGMIFDSPDKDNVRITWFLYRPDDNVYEAILSDGLVKDNGVVQQWTKKPGRYWIMCRVTAVNNEASSLCWGVEVRDGVVIDPQ